MTIKPHIKYSAERKQYSVSVGGKHIGWGRTLESMWRAHRFYVHQEIWRRESQLRHVSEAQAKAEAVAAFERSEWERKYPNLERAREMFRNGTYLYAPETLGLLPEA